MKKNKKNIVAQIKHGLANDSQKQFIFVTISDLLQDKKYNPYQRAFILMLVLKIGGKSWILSSQKKKIWFITCDKKTHYLPYSEDIQELIDDGFVTVISQNSYGKTEYELTDKAYGFSVMPFSETELSILSRGIV